MGSTSPTLSSLNSEDDIEMYDIPVSPNSYKREDLPESLQEDYDDDDDRESGERALLVENTQTSWKGERASKVIAFWKQTSGIVVEVSASSFQACVIDSGTLDTANAPFHHTRQPLHGGTVFKNIGMFSVSLCSLLLRCGSIGER